MDELALLVDLHKGQNRQGPGSKEATSRALELSGVSNNVSLKVADIGCGTGAATIQLAEFLKAEITAVDFLPDFLNVLDIHVQEKALDHKITTLAASMDDLPFEEGEFDLIWSEGAIYNMGFEKGIKAWRPFLKTGAVLAVSEITWLTNQRPKEINDYWTTHYPEIDTASRKIKILEDNGYKLLGYFPLSEECWIENYYTPLKAQHEAFLKRHSYSEAAQAIIEAEKQEITLYETYKDYYSYGFYIAQKG